MLKALELIGFKSFADKTRFEFPPGITVVVGPNGSGKSNIVDAMKWVLGAQSAKALRGKDMADVIFKGSSEGGRKMMNTAEATIIFENPDGKLPVDAEEVHVTRRVYRSGEGEYLINGQACRLKDIRDLFRGTGVGTDAYSLIEQGKVDRMLQASAKDRRSMFEEAAGISRFKAKKLEAQRRLDRVEQNLLRLSDIVDEVESRLRSVRSQAGKARRYREYSDRLQQLRTQVGLTDWWRLSQQLSEIEAELSRGRDEADEIAAQTESLEARALELDVESTNLVETTRVGENQVSRHREQIAVREASTEQARSSILELEEVASRHRRQLAAMTGRAGDLLSRLKETTDGLSEAETAYERIRRNVEMHEEALGECTAKLDALRGERDSRRSDYVDSMRAASTLANRLGSLESQLESLRSTEERARGRLRDVSDAAASSSAELQQARQRDEQLAGEASDKGKTLEAAKANLQGLQQQLQERRDELNDLRQQHSSVRERASVLDELEKTHEGLAAGVREVLEAAGDAADGPFAEVQGLVADLLQVDVDVAPLVDVALGERAQHLALTGDALLEEIQAGRYRPPGRVGFLRIHATPLEPGPELGDRPGVIARADRVVACSPVCEAMKQQLLGDTWLVESLSIALALRATVGSACRFVTAGGELLDRDGSVIVGPKLTAMGLVSRRSELRVLQDQLETMETRLGELGTEVETLTATRGSQRRGVDELSAEFDDLRAALVTGQAQTQRMAERVESLQEEQESLQEELEANAARQQAIDEQLQEDRSTLSELEGKATAAEGEVNQAETRIDDAEASRDEHGREATAAKVELAKSEQRLDSLRARMTQFEEDQRERDRALDESRTQLTQTSRRLVSIQRETLRATSELALLYLAKEQAAAGIASHAEARQQLAVDKAELQKALQGLRRRGQKLDEQKHKQELAAADLQHERRTLAERIQEDYGIDLAEASKEPTPEEQQEREEVEHEINELRRKLNGIGAVNTDALHELDDLEARFTSLSGQYNDLVQAKEALERIIHKINADSRRLFEETLEAIRANFQTLYRKAFGGGRADLVIEEGVDPLEAGVDIIATPPGKPSFSNSLLSGGEKALTAVALLLAIFQYRPSPFCVLDEVDAPFDEANIGRFVDVLHGFLDWTKFIIVTHSKKTMTAATTLYGVTMQESGVSKRVSVRFEDVSEDGHISQEAVDRENSKGDEAA